MDNNQGWAPIKQQYLVHTTTQPQDAVTNDKTESDQAQVAEPTKKEKYRGMNKGRHKKNAKAARELRKQYLCTSVYMQPASVCRYGDKCHFEHDVDTWLEAKPADLGNECPVQTARGQCNYGIACRFAAAHNIADSSNCSAATLVGNSSRTTNELNTDKSGLMAALRKKQCQFERADAAVDRIQQVNRATSSAELESETVALRSLLQQQEEWLPAGNVERIGALVDSDVSYGRSRPLTKADFTGKSYLAPLTTVGNLPFRRICKQFGADITCGEMAMSTTLLSGSRTEWSLVRRHPSETMFGVQLAGAHANTCARAAQLVAEQCKVDFIDLNVGCPIESICSKGAGSALLTKLARLQHIVRTAKAAVSHTNVGVTVKLRTGVQDGKNVAAGVIRTLAEDGCVDAIALHGRSKEQRYTKACDWAYIGECARVAREADIPFIGCGDVLSHDEFYEHLEADVDSVMIGRGALIKPWIFTEIQERRLWDISASERLDVLKRFVHFGLEHWGSDQLGVERTRRFLLEWLSFMHRYIPVGVLEVLPQQINQKPPAYVGRNDLECLLSSSAASDWMSITEMLLGKVPGEFSFVPKHKANAY